MAAPSSTKSSPMPTRKPRMSITLPDHVAAAVNALADASQKPPASVVAELLEEMVPQLEGLAKVMRASRAGNQAAAKRALTHMLGDSLAEMLAAQQPELFSKGGK
jgi:predicted DNA-binding protein